VPRHGVERAHGALGGGQRHPYGLLGHDGHPRRVRDQVRPPLGAYAEVVDRHHGKFGDAAAALVEEQLGQRRHRAVPAPRAQPHSRHST